MLTLYSPAKINLFLRIIRKRSDGYHEIASLFQTISLYDTITFQRSNQDILTCTDPRIPCDSSNLIYKALKYYRAIGETFPLQIHLEKRIPIESGLGGGSSNAATTLWALNQLSTHPLPLEELQKIAAKIGADVSFFLTEGRSYCTGIGEQLRPVPPIQEETLWIVKPQWGISTPRVYQTLDLNGVEERDPEGTLSSFLHGSGDYYNDLERAAFTLSPETRELKERLKGCGFHTVLMSGSGSSFFCLGEGVPPKGEGLKSFLVRTITRKSGNWYPNIISL